METELILAIVTVLHCFPLNLWPLAVNCRTKERLIIDQEKAADQKPILNLKLLNGTFFFCLKTNIKCH